MATKWWCCTLVVGVQVICMLFPSHPWYNMIDSVVVPQVLCLLLLELRDSGVTMSGFYIVFPRSNLVVFATVSLFVECFLHCLLRCRRQVQQSSSVGAGCRHRIPDSQLLSL